MMWPTVHRQNERHSCIVVKMDGSTVAAKFRKMNDHVALLKPIDGLMMWREEERPCCAVETHQRVVVAAMFQKMNGCCAVETHRRVDDVAGRRTTVLRC